MAIRNRGRRASQIEITYISNDGGGFAEKKSVDKGTTISEFLDNTLRAGVSFDDVTIRVNREPVESDYVLEADDTVSVTPKKYAGAIA